jgi:ParB/RepB/Spo0J family partition protein
MTEITYEDLQARAESVDPAMQEKIGALEKPEQNRYVLDDADQVFGYRLPAMFDRKVPVKWLDDVFSLETGKVVPMVSGKDLKAGKPSTKRKMREVLEERWVNKEEEEGTQAGRLGHDGLEILELRLDEMLPGPLNPRKRFEPEKLKELKESLRTHGFKAGMSRFWVRPHPTMAGMNEVVGGHRRRLMVEELIAEGHWPADMKFPAVREKLSDGEVIELALVESEEHERLSPLDYAEAVTRRLEMPEPDGSRLSGEKLAHRLAKSPMYISYCRSLSRLRGSEIGDALEAGALPVKTAVLLASIPSASDRQAMARRVLHPSDGNGPVAREILQRMDQR